MKLAPWCWGLALVAVGLSPLAVRGPLSETAAAGPAPGGAADRAAVEQALNNVFGWAVTKDFDLFFRTIADDADFISVTPYERVKIGVDDVKRDVGFWASPDFRAVRHELRDLKIVFSRGGDVAWFFCRVDDINEWKGEPANWENARWTGVLERRDGRWRVVQQHFSFAR